MENQNSHIRVLIEEIVRALVRVPSEVRVVEVPGPHATNYRIEVNPKDLGQVIGKHKKTARAIRAVVHAAARKSKLAVLIDITPADQSEAALQTRYDGQL